MPRIPHCCPLGGQRWLRGDPGRVSVPIRLDILSDQLPVIGLVSHYPTNHLIGRGLLPERRQRIGDFPRGADAPRAHAVLPTLLGWLSPAWGQITHVLLGRLPLCRRRCVGAVRLACVRHAASVHPEPGSNSHKLIALAVIASSRLLRCPMRSRIPDPGGGCTEQIPCHDHADAARPPPRRGFCSVLVLLLSAGNGGRG